MSSADWRPRCSPVPRLRRPWVASASPGRPSIGSCGGRRISAPCRSTTSLRPRRLRLRHRRHRSARSRASVARGLRNRPRSRGARPSPDRARTPLRRPRRLPRRGSARAHRSRPSPRVRYQRRNGVRAPGHGRRLRPRLRLPRPLPNQLILVSRRTPKLRLQHRCPQRLVSQLSCVIPTRSPARSAIAPGPPLRSPVGASNEGLAPGRHRRAGIGCLRPRCSACS